MATRFGYWTIIVDQAATSFRARRQDDLVPTLRQLQRRQPAAALVWFQDGRLWPTPEDAERARHEARERKRPRDWRPGGAHRDPRAPPDRKEKPSAWARRRAAQRARRARHPPKGKTP